MIKKYLSEFIIAVLIFGLFLSFIPQFLMWQRNNSNPEDWFEIKQIYVGDYIVDELPTFLYERTIKQPFSGRYDVEVQVVTKDQLYRVCGGRGEREYSPSKTLPANYNMEWFVGAKCVLPPGEYRLSGIWYIRMPNYPEMKYEKVSNIFKVLPKK